MRIVVATRPGHNIILRVFSIKRFRRKAKNNIYVGCEVLKRTICKKNLHSQNTTARRVV